MFVRCQNCDWEQDDFYDKDYNPTKSLDFWNQYLFKDNQNELLKIISDNSEKITIKELIAREYEKRGEIIRKMKWTTLKQFQNDPDKTCPKCGSVNLTID